MNQLGKEKSPYLLQHATNPIHWYSWSEEAFIKAKLENKPIFLSIGYSTCHWCHVMAHESFEDIEVANLLNQDYIAIKVDREERPDIDKVYMDVCQAMTGSGGWPLTIIMTPDQHPFFAGTYFPKERKYNRIGLIELLVTVSNQWNNNPTELIESSQSILNALKNTGPSKKDYIQITTDVLHKGLKQLSQSFDYVHGGFSRAPKFPIPHHLMFLLRNYELEGNVISLQMVEKTLQQMYKGGLFDAIGYGFSRYSTDQQWLVPHFEKMLYDNALLSIAYLEAYQVTKNEIYKEVAQKVIHYVMTELKDSNDAFYSAQDADSEGIEGKYYCFNPLEIIDLLGEEDGNYFNDYFDITSSGNFEGTNIPNRLHGNCFEKDDQRIDSLRNKVYEYRKKRYPLHTDHKILTSWNAYMIVALAKAYRYLKDDTYLEQAIKTLAFIEKHLIDNDRIMASSIDLEVKYKGYLDDYSTLIWVYIELFEVTFESVYLEKAIFYTDQMIDLFWDQEHFGFFLSGNDTEQLMIRPKEFYDGAIPSGNSVSALVLGKLYSITSTTKYKKYFERLSFAFSKQVIDYPTGFSFFYCAMSPELYYPTSLIILTKSKEEEEIVRDYMSQHFLSNTNIIVKRENDHLLEQLLPDLEDYELLDNKITIYRCEQGECDYPTHDFE